MEKYRKKIEEIIKKENEKLKDLIRTKEKEILIRNKEINDPIKFEEIKKKDDERYKELIKKEEKARMIQKYKNLEEPEIRISYTEEEKKELRTIMKKSYNRNEITKLKMILKIPLCDFNIEEIIEMDLFFFYEKLKKLNFSQLEKLSSKMYYSNEFNEKRNFFHNSSMEFEEYDNRYQLSFKWNAVSGISRLRFIENENKKSWGKDIKVVEDFF